MQLESGHRLRILRALLLRNPGIQTNPRRCRPIMPLARGSGWLLSQRLIRLFGREWQTAAPPIHMVDVTMLLPSEDVY